MILLSEISHHKDLSGADLPNGCRHIIGRQISITHISPCFFHQYACPGQRALLVQRHGDPLHIRMGQNHVDPHRDSLQARSPRLRRTQVPCGQPGSIPSHYLQHLIKSLDRSAVLTQELYRRALEKVVGLGPSAQIVLSIPRWEPYQNAPKPQGAFRRIGVEPTNRLVQRHSTVHHSLCPAITVDQNGPPCGRLIMAFDQSTCHIKAVALPGQLHVIQAPCKMRGQGMDMQIIPSLHDLAHPRFTLNTQNTASHFLFSTLLVISSTQTAALTARLGNRSAGLRRPLLHTFPFSNSG